MPRLPDPTPDQSAALNAVAHAAQERARWDRAYIAAILAAHEQGCTAVQISRSTGTTYQAVQSILRSPRT